MVIILEKKELTLEEFMRLQEDGPGWEYEEGRLIPLMPVEGQQSSAWSDLHGELYAYLKQHQLGKAWLGVLTYLEPTGKVRYFPDIVYLANDALDRNDGRKIVGAPTLVVEVTRPDSDEAEEGRKKTNYHRYGVPWYWIINTARGVTEEYRHEQEGYALVSETPLDEPFRPELFPGFEVVLAPPDQAA